jgi:formamidopyrimidine-DNA glycosylase
MTGQLVIGDYVLGHPTKDATKNLPNKSTRLIFHFSPPSSRGVPAGQGVLYFNDQRKFGWVKLLNNAELVEAQSGLGLDIFDPKFTPQYLFNQLQKTSRPVKLVLLDQHFFAGIGNIYANDALFLARIHPRISSKKITLKQAKLIHKSLLDIMRQSVLAGGSTARDRKYVRPDGTPGQNQFSFRVYQRSGEPCPKCGTSIKRISLGGRGTFFCPKCQKI